MDVGDHAGSVPEYGSHGGREDDGARRVSEMALFPVS